MPLIKQCHVQSLYIDAHSVPEAEMFLSCVSVLPVFVLATLEHTCVSPTRSSEDPIDGNSCIYGQRTFRLPPNGKVGHFTFLR